MSIDTKDVRDLINNPEGRTPYPEDSKVMLGSASDDSQIQDILNRLSALENAGSGGTYTLKTERNGDDVYVYLHDKDSHISGDTLELRGGRSQGTASSSTFKALKSVSFAIDNSNLNRVPEFNELNSSEFLKDGAYGYQSGAWQIDWKKTRTPLTEWDNDNSWSEHKGNYDEHNAMLLYAQLGESADASEHRMDAMYFFTNLFNAFLSQIIKPSLPDARSIIKFSVVDLGGNLMALNESVRNKVTSQITITNDTNSNYSSYVTATLGTTMSGALGKYGIYIEWDKKIIEDNTSDYNMLAHIDD